MKTRTHPLLSSSLGTRREVVSFHYGRPGARPKIYVQASLHADELPGMLVAHHLRRRLAALEDAGRLEGEVVVVPVANPIGLAQALLRSPQGRFDVMSGENFNRHYPSLADGVTPLIEGKLGGSAAANATLIRKAMLEVLAGLENATELESLRCTLLTLACDADVVLDLHCDNEAVLHLYTGSPLWPQCEPLARYLGAEATLLETHSGDEPFDEACSQTWWQLGEVFPGNPIPLACLCVTVELRGLGAVNHAQAEEDASRILDFLILRGAIEGTAPPLPPLKRPATPLAGSESLVAPSAGVIAFLREPGDWVEAGDAVADVIDPLTGETHTVAASVAGVLYARENRHYAMPGMRIAKVAGAKAFRTGKLLSD
jgi:predicted deacylase